MNAKWFINIALVCKLAQGGAVSLDPLSDEFIELINKEGKWKAGRNFPADTPMEYIKSLASTHIDLSGYARMPKIKHDQALIDSLPESFDPRDKWPNCPSLNEIRDQSRCGGCWAFGPVSAMTDRVCIYSNGTKNFHFSAEDIITCNSDVSDTDSFHSGCNGGSTIAAWQEWVTNGVVSGGNYNSNEGCKPYSFPNCADHMRKCTNYKPTPPCVKACREGYNKTYEEDKKRGKRFYLLAEEDNLKAELFKNGPFEVSFVVFEDFVNYKGGVYQHLAGEDLGGHAVKIMGWGVENGTKYWLLANSWGTDFGENGFFKMLRGTNECYIEMLAIAGEPLMEDY